MGKFFFEASMQLEESLLPVGATVVVTKGGRILSKMRIRFVKNEQCPGHPILKVDVIIGMVYRYPLFHTQIYKKMWHYATVYTFH